MKGKEMSTNSLASKGATTADRNMVNPDNRTGFWLHSLQNIEALGIGLVLAATILPLEAGSASATLTNADVLALQSALQQGGVVRLAFDGLMTLSNSFTITTNTTLDATGYAVTLDGGDRVRHFAVTNGITLRLINLALVNGRFVGPDTQINRPGNPGLGGSIYNSGGILELIDCRFSSNQVVGGRGGGTALQNVDEPTAGGPGEGAAIYSINGGVTATNCVFASNSCVGGEGAPDAAGGTGRGGDAFGGAIYGSLSQVTLTGVTLSNNFCKGGPAAGFRWRFGGGAAYGGALADGNGNTTVSNCVFSANHALGGSRYVFEAVSGNGGAIFHESGFLLIDRTLLSSNQANGGPGVVNGVDPTIAGDGNGGAIFNGGGRLELRNSALVLNQANGANATCCLNISRGGDGSGGGIYSGATLLLSNCTLAQNLAYGGAALETAFPAPSGSAYGGGIGVGGASLSLANVTVADNSVQVGPGTKGLVGHAIASSIFISSATGSLTNTILACSSS